MCIQMYFNQTPCLFDMHVRRTAHCSHGDYENMYMDTTHMYLPITAYNNEERLAFIFPHHGQLRTLQLCCTSLYKNVRECSRGQNIRTWDVIKFLLGGTPCQLSHAHSEIWQGGSEHRCARSTTHVTVYGICCVLNVEVLGHPFLGIVAVVQGVGRVEVDLQEQQTDMKLTYRWYVAAVVYMYRVQFARWRYGKNGNRNDSLNHQKDPAPTRKHMIFLDLAVC